MAKAVPSLRVKLLFWLLPVSAVAMLLSTLVVSEIVHDASSESLDQGLVDAAVLYVQHLREHPEAAAEEMPAHAQRVLLVTPDDRVFFSLRDVRGRVLAGDPSLAEDQPWGTLQEPAHFDSMYRGYWVRGISVVFDAGGRGLHVTLATTALKRDRLMDKILLGMVGPQTLLFLLTIALVWAGIQQGLTPLETLRGELSRRSHRDLRPLDEASAPNELRPIIEDFNKLMARLDLAIASQRHFIADAAHQLRTPIAGLLAQVESAGPDRVPPALLATARRLSRLVAQLLALSRAEPGVEFEAVRFDLAAEIRAVADDWLPAAFKRDIDVQFELAETPLVGSPQAIREMLANLLDNAIRYGRAGGRIVVRCLALPDEAVLQVDDDGPGIPAELRTQAFERFYRVPGTSAEGCGLGLAIVEGLARQHGAAVSLGEAPGLGGLRVEVRLPAVRKRSVSEP